MIQTFGSLRIEMIIMMKPQHIHKNDSTIESIVQQLHEVNQKYDRVLSLSPAVIYSCGPAPEFATTFISDNVQEKLGYAPEEFYSHPYFWTDKIHKDDVEGILQTLQETDGQDLQSYEYRFKHRDGHYVWLHDQCSVIRDESGQVTMLVGSWFDVTEKKRAEALRAGQNRVLKCLLDNSTLEKTLSVLALTIEEQSTGLLCSILIFDPVNQCLRYGAAPSLPSAYNNAIDGMKIGMGEGACGTAAFTGQPVIVVDIDTNPLCKNVRGLTDKYDLHACWSYPILSSSNRVLGTFAMYYNRPRDPSKSELDLILQAANLAAIAIEKHHADRTLRRSERMTSIGTLAAGIAHEINNPITSILLGTHNALTESDSESLTPRVLNSLNTIAFNAERCAQIIQSVLQFARNEPAEQWPHDIHELIQRAIKLTQFYLDRKNVHVDLAIAADLPEISVNPVQMVQVFVNLIQNAAESKEKDIEIRIRTEATTNMIRIYIQDNGCGMTDEQKRFLFDPFFTTREREGGVGLGLSITHGIVTSHGGSIDVRSAPDQGSTFIIELPFRSSQ